MSTKNAILNKEEIETTIKRITVNGKKLDGDIQAAAVGCINHIEQCGDVRLFNRLFLALPKGARKSALTGWVLLYGKVIANTDNESKKEQPFVYDKEKTTQLAEAQRNPWFDFAPDKAPDEVFDLNKAVASLLARAGRAESVNNPELLAKLVALTNEEA